MENFENIEIKTTKEEQQLLYKTGVLLINTGKLTVKDISLQLLNPKLKTIKDVIMACAVVHLLTDFIQEEEKKLKKRPNK